MTRGIWRWLLPIFALCTASGCVNQRQVMVDPKTWQQTVCVGTGFGLGALFAMSMHESCIGNQRDAGKVALEEAEAAEPAKIDIPVEPAGKEASVPQWRPGDFWEYGSGAVKMRMTVDRSGNSGNVEGYFASLSDGKEMFFDRSLGLMTIHGAGKAKVDYEPSLHQFDFPLVPGKIWQVKAEQLSSSRRVRISTRYEVRGYGRVRVPAGEFDAYYILGTNDYGARLSEFWYSPEVRNYVKAAVYGEAGRTVEELLAFGTGSR